MSQKVLESWQYPIGGVENRWDLLFQKEKTPFSDVSIHLALNIKLLSESVAFPKRGQLGRSASNQLGLTGQLSQTDAYIVKERCCHSIGAMKMPSMKEFGK